MRVFRLVILAALALPGALAAQLAGFADPVAQADMLFMAGQPELSYETLLEHVEANPNDYGALWRLSRAAVVVGLTFEGSRPQNLWLDPALHFAERALEIDPRGLDATYWRGAAAGRRAMNAKPGYAAELAQLVYDDAHAVLAADSLHGGAHNMLGKLNYEVMSLSRIGRMIARTFMGNEALDDTSWENAEVHLGRAAEAWPDFVLFHFDLGQLQKKRGDEDDAVRSYRQVLALPAIHPLDAMLQQQTREILDDLGVPIQPESGALAVPGAGDR